MNLSKWFSLGAKIGMAVVQHAPVIESLARSLPELKGKAKQDAVVELTKSSLEAAEDVAGKDILNDAKFLTLLRSFIDSYVALQNFIGDFKADKASESVETVN